MAERKRHLSYDEGKAVALAGGREQKRIRCPLCFWVRIKELFPEREGDPKIALSAKISNHGIFIDDDASLTLGELNNNAEWSELKEQIVRKCKEILEELQ